MKKIVAMAITASALLAGPDMGSLVDYDAQDNYVAQVQESQQYIPAPVVAPIVTAPMMSGVRESTKSCCPNRDSVDLMGGYNFTEDSGALGDAATAGIRYNKNIAPNTYIQLGYDRVFNADYKNRNLTRYNRSVSGSGAGASGSNGSGSTNGTTGSNASMVNSAQSGGTQLDRFYLNGLYEFCGKKKLTPYVFGGLGYENVRHESSDLESGGFLNAGAGLKYQLTEDFNLITEAKALRRFDNSDIDLIAGLGVGMMFGAGAMQAEPMPEMEIVQSAPSIIPNYAPRAIATVVPAPSSRYDNLDVVPIEEAGSFQTRAVFNEPARIYNNSTATSSMASGNYYIQVAALFSNDGANSNYFRKLDSAGLDHVVKQTTVRGRPVKLLLIGPYNSSSDARRDLSRAQNIERGAFVKKING